MTTRARRTPGKSTERASQRAGAAIAVALHVAAVAGLMSYEPARSALLAATPIMVDWIVPPHAQPPPPEPKPKPVVRRPPAPVPPVEPPPLMLAAQHAPSPIVAPAPPPEPPAPVEPPPAPVVAVVPPETPPIFNADYLDNPSPAYPAASRRAGEQGRVILRVLVNSAGSADAVEVRSSSGHARLDDAARDTVRRWRFVPAKRGAAPVPAWVLIPISFRLES